MSSATSATALVDRLRPRIDGDPILRDFRDSRPARLGVSAVLPSGVDLITCAVARSILPGSMTTIAIVLPRGQYGLPVMLGAYLVRWHRMRSFPGSVAVVSHRTRLREEARDLHIPERFDSTVPLAGLGAFPDRGGRMRAAAMPFEGDERCGLSQNHHFLLFQRPSVAPVLAQNVIATVVIDATESSPAAWEQLFQRHAGQRRQVWVGELGNTEFEDFCRANGIPVFRADWETIAAATSTLGVGSGPFTTAALCARAATLAGPGMRLCCHAGFDEELGDLSRRLALIHEMGRDDDEKPEAVRAAMRFSMLLRRLACPITTYDEQAARSRFARASTALLRLIEDAPRAAFRGRWKRAYDSHWGAVKGAANRLRELAVEECPKWWAVTDRVFEARDRDERLRIVCQTKAEQVALTRALVEGGVVGTDGFGVTIDVVTFADRLPPGEDRNLVTVYTSPLPPWRASAYLSAEDGRVEVLCYEGERRALATGLESTWAAAAGVERNHALLDALNIGAPVTLAPTPSTAPAIVELEPFRWEGAAAAPESVEDPDKVKEFWQQAVELYGHDVEVEEAAASERAPAATTPRAPVSARLVVFVDGSAVYLDEAVDYDVIVGGGDGGPPRVKPMPPRRLAPGLRLALLPGAARGSILQELMSAWDDRLQSAAVYDGLWHAALTATVDKFGVVGLAGRLGVTKQTVEIWVSGESWPQQRSWMVEILKQSGHEKAWQNRAAIVHYIRHTRGMHRLIGRVLNDAVAETIVNARGLAVRKLEQIVDQDLSDLFSAVRVLVVASVGEPEQVVPGRIGVFIDDIGETRGAP